MAFLKNMFKGKGTTKAPKAAVVEGAAEAVAIDRPAIPAPSSPVLRNFHISEKGTRGMAFNQYTFAVAPGATKTEVRDAVERSYKVDVEGVNIVNLPAKKRRLGRREGTVPARRKAIVTLKEGQSIAAAQP